MATDPKASPPPVSAPPPAAPAAPPQSATYAHPDPAVQRPAVGVQQEFPDRRPPRHYRYDSSLAPELAWDESAERDLAEWLLDLIERATTAIATAAAEGQGAGAEAAFFRETPPWAGTGERFGSIGECTARLKSLTRPFLNWAGKAERPRIRVPTIPLFVHERHSTEAILRTLDSYKAIGTTGDLFGDPQLDVADQLDAYEHSGPWSNRLVLGDSLQVMNSLLGYEGLGGQVQMIYMDPPYGVKFGSNFQPFVRKRDVKHGQDEDMIREPEMVKAYRDTWELGLHSYLTYLRDRLLLAKELLTESGSIFVQISEQNLHHLREVLDEVFGPENFLRLIAYKTTGSQADQRISCVSDYVIWYARNIGAVKAKTLYLSRNPRDDGADRYNKVRLSGGVERALTAEERQNPDKLPSGGRLFRLTSLVSQGFRSNTSVPWFFRDKQYDTGPHQNWKTSLQGLDRLASEGRVEIEGNRPAYKRFLDDFPVVALTGLWTDTQSNFAGDKLYAVQTAQKVIQRCMLMTTDPGDLVFDPTCGSGTTAYVAEQWGRRWITCDTSRVPLALARQRLLTATFPWYELKEPARGPAGGFVYQRRQNKKGEEIGGLVPRITLKSIANDEDPETVTLVDRPEVNNKITRVCGRFTVEATVQAAQNIEYETVEEHAGKDRVTDPAATHEKPKTQNEKPPEENPRRYLDRMIEVLRQSHTLRLPGNASLNLAKVRALSGEHHEYLHAEAEELSRSAEKPPTENEKLETQDSKRIAVVFGPEHGAIDAQLVFEAAREAYYLKYDALYLFGFAIEGKARELVADRKKLRLPCVYISVTPDVVMSDLLKTSKSSEVFAVTGLPDVRVERVKARAPGDESLYQVELLGLDIFRPHDLETESISADNLPCWMLDTDYNGMVFMARQVFFPKTSAWDNLERSLRGRFAEGVWSHLAGTRSEPFAAGLRRQIAVKVIDERGDELMVVRDLG